MKILVADDDLVVRKVVVNLLTQWGHEVAVADDGASAWELIQQDRRLRMALLDRQMPGMDGLEVIRHVREQQIAPFYAILLTMHGGKFSHIDAIEAGADDFMTKPFDKDVLAARVKVGVRHIETMGGLVQRVVTAEKALAGVTRLGELLPVCSGCGAAQEANGAWHKLALPVNGPGAVTRLAGPCPDCAEKK